MLSILSCVCWPSVYLLWRNGHVLYFLWTSVLLSSGINHISLGWCEDLGGDTWKAGKHWARCLAGNKCLVNVSIFLSFLRLRFPLRPPPHTQRCTTTTPGQWENPEFYKNTILTLGAFRLVFSNFFDHSPQSEKHLNKTMCGLVGGKWVQALNCTSPGRTCRNHKPNTPLLCIQRNSFAGVPRKWRRRFVAALFANTQSGTTPMSTSPGAEHGSWCTHRRKSMQHWKWMNSTNGNNPANTEWKKQIPEELLRRTQRQAKLNSIFPDVYMGGKIIKKARGWLS